MTAIQILTEWTRDTAAFDPSTMYCTFTVAGERFKATSRIAGWPVCLTHDGRHFHMGAWNRSDWVEKAAEYLNTRYPT